MSNVFKVSPNGDIDIGQLPFAEVMGQLRKRDTEGALTQEEITELLKGCDGRNSETTTCNSGVGSTRFVFNPVKYELTAQEDGSKLPPSNNKEVEMKEPIPSRKALKKMRSHIVKFRRGIDRLAKSLGNEFGDQWPDSMVDIYEFTRSHEFDSVICNWIANADEILVGGK